ncbi:MAG: hypothetical protein ACREB3_11135 [Burkholderiales bacterium]
MGILGTVVGTPVGVTVALGRGVLVSEGVTVGKALPRIPCNVYSPVAKVSSVLTIRTKLPELGRVKVKVKVCPSV